jgi:pimeloyl-ACP methyl ester carboxylesterase
MTGAARAGVDRRTLLGAAAATAFAAGGAAARMVDAADGAPLFVRDWGDGPAVALLASWSLPSDSWFPQMAALMDAGFRVVAYDRRGHGRSEDPGRGYDFDTLAGDLTAVLAARDVRDATAVGFSMAGGEIVRAVSQGAGERIARAVLIGTTTPCLTRRAANPDGVPAEAFEAFRRDELAKDFPQWIEDNLAAFAPGASRPTLEWVRAMALGASLPALIACHREITGADFRPEMARLRTPTLLLHGSRDATSPPALTAAPSARLMPHARLEIIEGAPHGLPFSHARLVSDRIAAFARGAP